MFHSMFLAAIYHDHKTAALCAWQFICKASSNTLCTLFVQALIIQKLKRFTQLNYKCPCLLCPCSRCVQRGPKVRRCVVQSTWHTAAMMSTLLSLITAADKDNSYTICTYPWHSHVLIYCAPTHSDNTNSTDCHLMHYGWLTVILWVQPHMMFGYAWEQKGGFRAADFALAFVSCTKWKITITLYMNPVDNYLLHQELLPKLKAVKRRKCLCQNFGNAETASFIAQLQIRTFSSVMSCHTSPVESTVRKQCLLVGIELSGHRLSKETVCSISKWQNISFHLILAVLKRLYIFDPAFSWGH